MRKPLVISSTGVIEERQRQDSLLVPFCIASHFEGNALDNIWATATAGGGGAAAASNVDTLQGMFGALRLLTGTSTTGGALTHAGQNQIRTGGVYGFRFITVLGVQTLSNSTNRYVLRAGLSSAVTTFGDTTGFYLRYTDNVNAGRFQGVVRNGATESVVNFLSAPIANTPFALGFEINVGFSEITFFSINSNGNYTSEGSIVLAGGFVPAANTLMGPCVKMQKAVGTTSVAAFVDYISCEVL